MEPRCNMAPDTSTAEEAISIVQLDIFSPKFISKTGATAASNEI